MTKPRFPLLSTVYLKVNDEMVGVVTGHLYRPGILIYLVRWSDTQEGEHFDAELVETRTYRGDNA